MIWDTVVDIKMRLLIRLAPAPKAYFTFYISQISSLPEIPCSQYYNRALVYCEPDVKMSKLDNDGKAMDLNILININNGN
jgi:hypothetical protein